MSQSRIEIFEAMTRDQPGDAMIWYGLANEYIKIERLDDAVEALRKVIEINPDYTAAYQILGSALMKRGDRGEARRIWTVGVEAAKRSGAWKAQQHMQNLLADTEPESGSGFCSS
jgi:predicted Zn-dependent protease